MKRVYFTLGLNLIFACALAYITISTFQVLRYHGDKVLNGWLFFSPITAVVGLAPVVILIVVLAIDSLWLLFFVIWLLKRIFRIKDPDNTLYLP